MRQCLSTSLERAGGWQTPDAPQIRGGAQAYLRADFARPATNYRYDFYVIFKSISPDISIGRQAMLMMASGRDIYILELDAATVKLARDDN